MSTMFGITPFERKGYDLFNAFHDFEDDFFKGSAIGSCKTDIKDEGDKFILECELPGFEKEDINIDISGGCLTISAQHSASNDEKDNNGNYIRRERSSCSYQRSFDISDCDEEKIGAEYKNGILIVDLPKQTPSKPQAKRLEIK